MTWSPSDRQLVGGVVVVATLTAGLVVSLGLNVGRDGRLTAPYPIHGRRAIYPAIGDATYSHACRIFRWYETGEAFAFCHADGGAYRWLPDQQRWNPNTTTR